LIGSDIAKRYARALFDIAQKEDKIEIIYGELKGFSSILKENRELADFLPIRYSKILINWPL